MMDGPSSIFHQVASTRNPSNVDRLCPSLGLILMQLHTVSRGCQETCCQKLQCLCMLRIGKAFLSKMIKLVCWLVLTLPYVLFLFAVFVYDGNMNSRFEF